MAMASCGLGLPTRRADIRAGSLRLGALVLLLLECGVAQDLALPVPVSAPTAGDGETGLVIAAAANATDEACPFTSDGECDEGTFCEEATDVADCAIDAPDCPWVNDGECDVPESCPEATDRADCSLPSLEALGVEVSGRLFCETADFFNNTVAAECDVQICCEWLEGQGCLSSVGDESCGELDDADDAMGAAEPTATDIQVSGGLPSGADEEEEGDDDEPQLSVLELGVVAAGVVVLGAALLVVHRKRGGAKEAVDEEQGADRVVRDSTAETATLQGSGMKSEHSEANP